MDKFDAVPELYPRRARLSPFNRLSLDGAGFSPQVRLNDVTLREGEQASCAAFTWDDRRRIATELDAAGVPSIQLAFAKGSSEAREETRTLVACLERARAQVLVVGFAADWKQQIDAALGSDVSALRLVFRCSDILLEGLGVSRQEALERSEQVVAYACGQGAAVEFSATDATRADAGFLRAIWRVATDAGATVIGIPDTVGVATPEAMAYLVGVAQETTALPIAVHCHNDFGLAVANTIAGLRAGARIADVTINGLGDRSGNAPLDEVVMCLHLLYGVMTGIEIERLTDLSTLLADITGIPLPEQKPIVGTQAFAHKLDIHVQMAVREPLTFQAFVPELVGNRQRILLGRLSGPHAARAKLAELGYSEPDEATVKAVLAFAEEWTLTKHLLLPDDEVVRFLQERDRAR
jgi:isopropylmalate/homocitrate/citramalate synthase